MLLLLIACAQEPDPSALEERVAQLEGRLALLEAPETEEPLTLRGLELRVQALEAAGSGVATVGVDPSTGRLQRVLDEDQVLACAATHIFSVRDSQLAYDAAFDEVSQDLKKIGWEMDMSGGCQDWIAIAVTRAGEGDFEIVAVITRGNGRGRRFMGTRNEQARELARLDEAGIAAFLSETRWVGSAR